MKKRFLGIDLGTKRIGLAISDPLNITSQKYQTIEFQGKQWLAERLNQLIIEKNIGTLVFGLPIPLSGRESKKTKEVRVLVDFLRTKLPREITIAFEDESLTSLEAEKIIRQLGKKPSKNKALIDQVAAQKTLERYMEQTYD